ncbi:MAG: metalloregulator ArsR/SmtB family transcription factor [Agitococcus sp.]|nr:metalloregulator ArsR/SmtB family transcription factor [Agitococcus sp.]
MSHLHDLAQAFKALSHPNRLQIYVELLQLREKVVASGTEKECSCGLTDFMSKLNIGAPTVSHHIKELVNAKLIRIERQGKFMTCYLNNDMRAQLEAFFAQQK